MNIEFLELPYAKNALEPHISESTIEFHYEKHHRGYFNKLVEKISNTDLEDKSLTDIIKTTDIPEIYNLAAQIWNHDFYWRCMTPNGRAEPPTKLKNALIASFGSVETFMQQISEAGKTHFGSGWVWLVAGDDGKLTVIATNNAENPLSMGLSPLLTLDVWEHAYYLDYKNARPSYVDDFFENLIDWDFVEHNLEIANQLQAA